MKEAMIAVIASLEGSSRRCRLAGRWSLRPGASIALRHGGWKRAGYQTAWLVLIELEMGHRKTHVVKKKLIVTRHFELLLKFDIRMLVDAGA